ncbi:FeoB-associated Cys-rich membrane protein [Oribacterium sp. WCC10]|uniref:FeoB-associated Cys-rich membrane protein n=1 Tax=Oribacterium sp. WCC10 TaxID=1855343 RepID=UPI0008E01DD4|nr:FeoB-associated Cys-rich membrane protein [Oribacterium sp. WCC10]SFG14118.1 Virus attachment protein p12 family protein [Oribacterium sp. WCC10]
MADFIIITILIVVALLIIRKLYRDYKKYGTCAGCAEAQLGHCNHVGHKELDERRAELDRIKLNEVQKAILAKHARNKCKNK